MPLKTVHNDILAAIASKVNTLTAIKSVTIGELAALPPDKFPACYIIPKLDAEEDHTVSKILHKFRTAVVILARAPASDPLSGMTSILDLSADAHDKLLEDRTLGGKCEILYFIDRDFDYLLGQDYHLFWTIIAIEPWKAV